MADLLTHYAAARLASAGLRSREAAAAVIAGTFLPDLVSKGLYWVAQAHPEFDDPSHSLPGLALLCYLAALFTPERTRAGTWAALYAGGLLHVFVDFFKDTLGSGAGFPLLPFSRFAVEFPCISPEDVILLLPANLLVIGLAWGLERVRGRSA